MSLLWDVKWVLLAATLTTGKIFIFSALLALALALVVGLASVSRLKAFRWAALTFGELFRGVSLVVQLFWIFFVLPFFGITLSATTAAILGLGLCFGAYGSEVVRASLLAVSGGQRQAAAALGFPPRLSMTLIELPQALLIMLPPMGNLLVLILKSTSVTALITVPELSFTANALNANVGASLAIFGYVMFAYYFMAKLVLWGTTSLENKLGRVRIVNQRAGQA